MSVQAAPARIVEQTVIGGVLAKLALFSLMLAVGPIGTYFGMTWYITKDTNIAAIAAIVVANLVLVGYIMVAIAEDMQDQLQTQQAKEKLEVRKTQ
ncbi:hypothetical protein DACRYDRAFT_103176 [Dacryopinax primogenitus]|uniref:Vacuolar ATPase assembly integral membrane protein VMA21 n=1 Tax=Dacryopinax primogenitus (strain DJM 731) TaxID=1858805 RepID=M5G7Q8_DACPD|nr:uncharacterized protein DACRYDRAFT_103176 [Dacryopinax primogenitus]EJU06231.1 hypothetical protein DACRYDRAFT_103176 [Dacryopinax primogenitus]